MSALSACLFQPNDTHLCCLVGSGWVTPPPPLGVWITGYCVSNKAWGLFRPTTPTAKGSPATRSCGVSLVQRPWAYRVLPDLDVGARGRQQGTGREEYILHRGLASDGALGDPLREGETSQGRGGGTGEGLAEAGGLACAPALHSRGHTSEGTGTGMGGGRDSG